MDNRRFRNLCLTDVPHVLSFYPFIILGIIKSLKYCPVLVTFLKRLLIKFFFRCTKTSPLFDRSSVHFMRFQYGLYYTDQTEGILKGRLLKDCWGTKEHIAKSAVSDHSWNSSHLFQFERDK